MAVLEDLEGAAALWAMQFIRSGGQRPSGGLPGVLFGLGEVMGLQRKTLELIDAARAELLAYNPMTLRQVFYRLVSEKVLKNTRGQYQRLSRALVSARQEELIPWEWIEDRLREPESVAMWEDLGSFLNSVIWRYRRDVWETQPGYLEVWLEKDALSGIFGQVLRPYGVTLNVGRGFTSWSWACETAWRLSGRESVAILCFSDFDPSGQDMIRTVREQLAFFGCHPEIVKVALLKEDIERHDLPADFTKITDTRRDAFIARYGDIAVELDALPPPVLRERLEAAVRDRLDLDALERVKELERQERQELRELLSERD